MPFLVVVLILVSFDNTTNSKNEMATLAMKIFDLEEEIEGYKADLKIASSSAEKSELRGLIKTSGETLNRLLDEKKASSGGKV